VDTGDIDKAYWELEHDIGGEPLVDESDAEGEVLLKSSTWVLGRSTNGEAEESRSDGDRDRDRDLVRERDVLRGSELLNGTFSRGGGVGAIMVH